MTNNFFPDSIGKIYLMGICGTGMASLAGLLKERGHDVCGSDANVYPPMSDELKKQNIPVFSPYSAQNLENAKPDLVIVGNVISRPNPEAAWLLDSSIPYVSMPQALKHFFLHDKEVIAITGTHGKTTTTALMAFLLDRLELNPSYLIGGVSQDFGRSFHISTGKHFVIEGDEYDTAFFDKGPKFLHYNPTHVVMTSLEFDHADIYRDLNHVIESFDKLSRIIPQTGTLHYCDEYTALSNVVKNFSGFTRSYGFNTSEWRLENFFTSETGTTFALTLNGQPKIKITSPLFGKHNALNVAACFSVLEKIGANLHQAAAILPEFGGIKRRQEILHKDDNLVVIDDFAHHPTAVTETIQAVRAQYPSRHLLAIFEPRSNTTIRSIFQDDYAKSLAFADETLLAPVYHPQKITDGHILDVAKLALAIQNAGKTAHHFTNTEDIIKNVVSHSQKPLVALIMSNGGFDNIHKRLIQAWQNHQTH